MLLQIKKLPFLLLVIFFPCSFFGMNRKVEPPSYFDEGLKVAGGLGSILAGASVVRKSFEHMQTIPVTWTVEGIKHSAKIFKDQFLSSITKHDL